MLDEKIILEESKVQYEHKLNNVNSINNQIAYNPKYTALNSGNPGEIILYNKNKENIPLKIKLDNNEILDLEFSPFNNEHLAIYTKINIISIFDLSEYNENEEQMKPKYSLKYDSEFALMTVNPAKENILSICDNEGNITLWDINSDKTFNEYNREKNPTRLLWNPNGNCIGICFVDGLLKIYNIIDNNNNFEEILEEKISQKESLSNSFTWLSDNSFATIGWGEDNCKNLSIWNNFEQKDNSIFGECSIYSIRINESDSDIIPFSNKEYNLIYLVNKKEDNLPSITVYEFNENQIIKKLEYFSTYPAAFSILINNNYCDNTKNEIDRFIRYNSEDNKIYFVSIFKKVENEQNLNKDSEIQENINENLEKENNDLRMKLQEKEKENNSLKKVIEDNNNENNRIIEGQKIKINTYDQKQKELEGEIDKLNEELDKVKYKSEQYLANKIKLEKELSNNLNNKLSIIKPAPEQLSSINEFSGLVKNNDSISLKLEKCIINRDNNLGESANENEDNINQEYKIYNLDVVDKNKEIVMIFGNEYRSFTFKKYNESMKSP